MTKAELEIKVRKQEQELANYQNMKKIIEEKDAHINELQKSCDKRIITFREQKDKEIAELRSLNEQTIKSVEDKYKNSVENLTNTIKLREQQLDRLLTLYGNLLKSLQGTIDNGIELNDFFIRDVSR